MEVKKGLSQRGQACAWITVKFSSSIMVCSTQDAYWICLEHFVMLEMLQESGKERYKGHLLHELACAGGKKWLEAGDQKALRVTHGSQRLLMPGEPSVWANSPRCAHVSEDSLSAEEREDDETRREEPLVFTFWTRRIITTSAQCYCSAWELPVQLAYLHCTSYPGAY